MSNNFFKSLCTCKNVLFFWFNTRTALMAPLAVFTFLCHKIWWNKNDTAADPVLSFYQTAFSFKMLRKSHRKCQHCYPLGSQTLIMTAKILSLLNWYFSAQRQLRLGCLATFIVSVENKSWRTADLDIRTLKQDEFWVRCSSIVIKDSNINWTRHHVQV